MTEDRRRPAVTVIVPFIGPDVALTACLEALGGLALRPGDEILVADNRPQPGAPAPAGGVHVIRAAGVRAAGFARNRAAAVAHGEWLVFLDADTRPAPDLLDRYFDPPPGPDTAVLAGGIRDVPGAAGAAARHSAGRCQMSQRATLDRAGTPYAQSANLAVRRTAFTAAGGFDERIRSGEDADLCFRLQRAGWRLEERDRARVEHVSRPDLRGLLTQVARHGSGARWLQRRYPGEFAPAGARALAAITGRGVVRAGVAAARRDRPAATAALLSVAEQWAFAGGRLLPNTAPRQR